MTVPGVYRGEERKSIEYGGRTRRRGRVFGGKELTGRHENRKYMKKAGGSRGEGRAFPSVSCLHGFMFSCLKSAGFNRSTEVHQAKTSLEREAGEVDFFWGGGGMAQGRAGAER